MLRALLSLLLSAAVQQLLVHVVVPKDSPAVQTLLDLPSDSCHLVSPGGVIGAVDSQESQRVALLHTLTIDVGGAGGLKSTVTSLVFVVLRARSLNL